jgi:predicted phage terminase large subunit-like protein
VWGLFHGSAGTQANRLLGQDGKPMDVYRAYLDGPPKLVLMYAWNKRLELHELVQEVAKTCRLFQVDKLLIENKAAGISAAQELRRLYGNEGYAVQLNDPRGQDKLARLYSVQHLFAEGMIYAPDRKWAEEVIGQVSQFPAGKHDDLVDTVSQALRHMRDMGLLTRAQERLEEIESLRQYHGRPEEPLYPA